MSKLVLMKSLYVSNYELTVLGKEEIKRRVNEFVQFIDSDQKFQIHFVHKNAEWVMQPETKNKLSFNTKILRGRNFEFYLLIVLHELIHAVKQNIPSKENVKTLEENFSPHFMNFFDLEADYYAAKFFGIKCNTLCWIILNY